VSYAQAMEMAGAEILAFEQFGSYQGEWYAKVRYEGEVGWVQGSYGSCSGCDAFEAEFGYGDHEHCEEHRYQSGEVQCIDCRIAKNEYMVRMVDFGKGYLTLQTQDWAVKEASRNLEWDSDAQEVLNWLLANAITEDEINGTGK
jgi:hypothetical protein